MVDSVPLRTPSKMNCNAYCRKLLPWSMYTVLISVLLRNKMVIVVTICDVYDVLLITLNKRTQLSQP